jgi:hypothetical protein
MRLADEPPGWKKLQAMAQSAKDTESLDLIVNKMNELLTLREKSVGRKAERKTRP